jgi:hypothetical protein
LEAQAIILQKYGYLCTYQIGGSKTSKIEYEALEAAMGVHEQCLVKCVYHSLFPFPTYSLFFRSFKQLGCIPQLVSTLLSLSKLVTDNLQVLTSALMLRDTLVREEDEEGEEGEGEMSLDSDVSPSLELLSKAMELLLQAQEYATHLMAVTVVRFLSCYFYIVIVLFLH